MGDEVLAKICDAYYEYEPHELEPGGARTFVNIVDIIFDANRNAELALDFYNRVHVRSQAKKFKLVKVCKLNYGGTCLWMIFCAQVDGSDELYLFRGVVDVHDEVSLCEIKYDAGISNLVDDVDDYVKKIGKRDEDPPSDTWYNKDDLGDCSAPGSDGVILVSPTMFRIIGEKSFADLHKMCDDYMDPCLYEKCEMMTSVDINCFDWATKYAKLAMSFYNQKDQKNFILIKVERLYAFVFSLNRYCMTFWARNDGSDEFRLFRAVLLKEEDQITVPVELDDACVEQLDESDELYLPLPCDGIK